MQPRHANAGFTLIELLVGLVLFAILITSSYQLFNRVLAANERSETQFQQQQQLAVAWAVIFQDLIQVRTRPHRNILGGREPAYQSNNQYLARFIRAGLPPINGVTPGGMQHIAYALEDNKLYRLSWPVLDLANDSEPLRQLLLEGVQQARFEHLNANNDYVEYWPPVTSGNTVNATVMPRMLRITIEFDDGRSIQRLLPGVQTS